MKHNLKGKHIYIVRNDALKKYVEKKKWNKMICRKF